VVTGVRVDSQLAGEQLRQHRHQQEHPDFTPERVLVAVTKACGGIASLV
jgi:hypothetical protein